MSLVIMVVTLFNCDVVEAIILEADLLPPFSDTEAKDALSVKAEAEAS